MKSKEMEARKLIVTNTKENSTKSAFNLQHATNYMLISDRN